MARHIVAALERWLFSYTPDLRSEPPEQQPEYWFAQAQIPIVALDFVMGKIAQSVGALPVALPHDDRLIKGNGA